MTAMALQEGKIYPAHIESYASDGTGVARIDGMVVFVHGAVRGEEADVCIEHVGHNAPGPTSPPCAPHPPPG